MANAKAKLRCPDDWKPHCSCDGWDMFVYLEPNEKCYIHGFPDPTVCDYCGQFVAYGGACKRCGWHYWQVHEWEPATHV